MNALLMKVSKKVEKYEIEVTKWVKNNPLILIVHVWTLWSYGNHQAVKTIALFSQCCSY